MEENVLGVAMGEIKLLNDVRGVVVRGSVGGKGVRM